MDRARIEAALAQFRGDIAQTPPMYSALKHAGKPLYRYAREGQEVPREPRRVAITRLTLEGILGTDLEVAVDCSKGTYVRVLRVGRGPLDARARRAQAQAHPANGSITRASPRSLRAASRTGALSSSVSARPGSRASPTNAEAGMRMPSSRWNRA